MKRKKKKHYCPICGTQVKVVGNVTLHYEPVLLTKEDIVKILEKNNGVNVNKLAEILEKEISGK